MTTEEKIQIKMSERRPINIVKSEWPLIARASRHDGGQHECQANHEWAIRVREHKDGRRIVCGWLRAGSGGVHIGWRGAEGGFLIPPTDGQPDDAETIRAIRRVGGIIGDDALADECIGDMPAEDDVAPPQAASAGASETVVAMHALLVRALPHVPEPLNSELRERARALTAPML